MQLVLNNGLFYEFVPFTSENFDEEWNLKPGAKTLTIGQIEEGKEYAILLTTCAGAYRYLIGDTVKFTNKGLCELVITGRTKHFLSLCGEHLSVENMTMAIKMAEDNLNIEVREFTVAGVKHDSMFAHKWFVGTDSKVDTALLRTTIDENLKILNDDYRVERIAAIKDVILEVLPTAVFYDWMRMKGKEGAQNKFPRVIKGAVLEEWENYVVDYKSKK